MPRRRCDLCGQLWPRPLATPQHAKIIKILEENPDQRHTSYTIGNDLGLNGTSLSQPLRRMLRDGIITWDHGPHGEGIKLV